MSDNPVLRRLVPTDQMVLEIASDLGINESLSFQNIALWLFEAQLLWRLPVAFADYAVILDISTNATVTKPCNFVRLKSARIGDCETIPYYRPIEPALVIDTCPNVHRNLQTCEYSIQEHPGYFALSANTKKRTLHLWYQGYFLVDDQPVFDRHFKPSYTDYVRYKLMGSQQLDGTYSINEVRAAKVLAQESYEKDNANYIHDNITQDALSQIMSEYNDPYRFPQNPYTKRNSVENVAWELNPQYSNWGWGGNMLW